MPHYSKLFISTIWLNSNPTGYGQMLQQKTHVLNERLNQKNLNVFFQSQNFIFINRKQQTLIKKKVTHYHKHNPGQHHFTLNIHSHYLFESHKLIFFKDEFFIYTYNAHSPVIVWTLSLIHKYNSSPSLYQSALLQSFWATLTVSQMSN